MKNSVKICITGVFFKFLYELPEDNTLEVETCSTVVCQSLQSGV